MPSFHAAVILTGAAALASCADSPPGDRVDAEIHRSILSSNSAMYEGGAQGAEVVGLERTGWKEAEFQAAGTPTSYTAEWTARLRFKEPLACIVAEVDGTRIVKVVAEKGEELPFQGVANAMSWEGKWEVNASVKDGDSFTGPGAWQPIADRAPGLTMGYQVVRDGNQQSPKFRARNFEPLSQVAPCIVEGSKEHEKLLAEMQERWNKAQAAVAERQRAQEEERTRAAAEAAERQRVAQEEAQRKQAEDAERQRLAVEETKRKQAEAAAEAAKKADEARRARLLAVLEPFQSKSGAVVTAEAGPTLGTVLLDARIDAEKMTVSGRAVDLREMPVKELTFDGAVDERGAFSLTTSPGGSPVAYGAAGGKLGSRAGFTIAALSAEERANLDGIVATAMRLGTAAPVALEVESLDAEAAQAREPQLKLAGLSGSVFYRGRLNAAVNPLFAADLGANKTFAWRSKEVVAIRLGEPVKGSGIYVRGTAAPSTELVVTVNGVHRATVPSIPKLGGVIIELPAELEVLDLRLEATGAVSARTIGLVR
jgi:hypothetical protein